MNSNLIFIGGGILLLWILHKNSPQAQAQAAFEATQTLLQQSTQGPNAPQVTDLPISTTLVGEPIA